VCLIQVKRIPLLSDQDLVTKICRGETRRFGELIDRYQRLVVHIVYRMTNDRQVSEDLTQEIFIKVYDSLAGFRFDSKLSTWISRIAYNTCINYLRKEKPLSLEDLPENRDTGEWLVSPDRPDEFTEHNDQSRYIMELIKQLPAVYRAIVTMFHLQEMSYREIAEVVDMPEGTVKSYLFRARKILREHLVAAEEGVIS
jgi:RNA polymerase sigma factor (sigma-70 family)